jgi:hypothetical protein
MKLNNLELLNELANLYRWRLEAFYDSSPDWTPHEQHEGKWYDSSCWEVLFTNGDEHIWCKELDESHMNVLMQMTWIKDQKQSINSISIAEAFDMPLQWAAIKMRELVHAYRKFREPEGKLLSAYSIERMGASYAYGEMCRWFERIHGELTLEQGYKIQELIMREDATSQPSGIGTIEHVVPRV